MRPLLSISPHGGEAVAAVVLLSAPRRPDHHVLLTTVYHFPVCFELTPLIFLES